MGRIGYIDKEKGRQAAKRHYARHRERLMRQQLLVRRRLDSIKRHRGCMDCGVKTERAALRALETT